MTATTLMKHLLVLTSAVLCLTSAAAASLPPAVRSYVEGWQTHDGRKVEDAVGDDGGYRDPGVWAPLSGPQLADYVEGFKAARITLLETRAPARDRIDLVWQIVWPDARGALRCIDHLYLQQGAIQMVLGEGEPIPAQFWPVINSYFRFREAADVEQGVALFGADGVIEARFPPAYTLTQLGGARLRTHLEGDRGWHFFMKPGGVQQMSKDGRPAVDFQINKRDGSLYVSGRELFSIKGEQIERLTGLF